MRLGREWRQPRIVRVAAACKRREWRSHSDLAQTSSIVSLRFRNLADGLPRERKCSFGLSGSIGAVEILYQRWLLPRSCGAGRRLVKTGCIRSDL
eukprot:5592014-Pleurochrysis_carterae.AAC.1